MVVVLEYASLTCWSLKHLLFVDCRCVRPCSACWAPHHAFAYGIFCIYIYESPSNLCCSICDGAQVCNQTLGGSDRCVVCWAATMNPSLHQELSPAAAASITAAVSHVETKNHSHSHSHCMFSSISTRYCLFVLRSEDGETHRRSSNPWAQAVTNWFPGCS